MINQTVPQIKSILDNLAINELANVTQFAKRRARKVDATSFLISFFLMMLQGNYSLRLWASHLSMQIGEHVSFQAIAKKLEFRQASFFHAVFQKVLDHRIQSGLPFEVQGLFKRFNEVLVEDSTCFKLPKRLFEFYPGPRLPHGRLASGRVQLRLYLKSNTYGGVAMHSYCQNDQKYADDILKVIQKGDLIIRDLGYWVLDVLRKIGERGAFFLSRLRLGTCVLEVESQQVIDLAAFLKCKEHQGIMQVDMPVMLDKKKPFAVRLVAVKLSEKNAMKRRKMAKYNRHKKTSISAKSWYLMSWNIFVTNVPVEIWQPVAVFQAYNLRWHIEMIFKCWKSKFHFSNYFKYCHGRNPVKPEILLLLILTWLVLFFVPMYNRFAHQVYKKTKGLLSPFRFADFLKSHFYLFAQPNSKDLINALFYYCCYDRRKDRKNHFEKLYMNFLS